jgi:subtilisin family serine protease
LYNGEQPAWRVFQLKFLIFTAAFGLLIASAFGQDALHPHFVAVKGNHEFTGQMIARPKQISQLMQGGLTHYQAQLKKQHAASLVALNASEYRPQVDEYIVDLPAGKNEDQYAAALLATGEFQYVEPNWRVFITAGTNDPGYPQQWHLPKIQADLGWDLFVGNDSIIVAITDTGVRLDHEDLSAKLVSGYNSATGVAQANGGDVNDTHGHGTHCAGIAGAIGNNGIGVTGACQKVKIMPIKVVIGGSGSSSIAALTNGAIWAADHGARVISTSFSGFDSSSSVQTTGNYIKVTKKGFYCWAAGNDGRNLTSGDWPDVTIVGASDHNDLRAGFSAYGPAIDVFAPGVDILSTYANAANGYAFSDGTSMACPLAAGTAALCLMANPSMTGQQIEDRVYQNCVNIGSSTTFGNGRINANLALRSVYNNFTFSPSTATVTVGTPTGGGVAQLAFMDNQFMTGAQPPEFRAAAVCLQVQFDTYTTISNMGSMTFTFAGYCSSSVFMQTIELYNWTTNTWVQMDQRAGPVSNTQIVMNPGSPNSYRQAGTGLIRSRVSWGGFSSRSPVSGWIDQVAFKTAP